MYIVVDSQPYIRNRGAAVGRVRRGTDRAVIYLSFWHNIAYLVGFTAQIFVSKSPLHIRATICIIIFPFLMVFITFLTLFIFGLFMLH